ncbi:MAG: BCCT family transporter [Nocardioidaceae bacterium]|nr:BCCT family transporter [Nocardioidaceae bacterium]
MTINQRKEDSSVEEREDKGRLAQFGAVFYITVGISVAFVLAGVLFTKSFGSALTTIVEWIIIDLGWFYLLVTTFFLVFVLFLAFSKYGKLRLGGPDEKPEFGRFAWFAMLFQAGMGIGLLFWGVAQPLLHYRAPPFQLEEPGTPDAAALGMQFSFFHWTLHPWAIYAVVGLAVAYFSFVRGTASLRISSVFRPLIGDRVDGPIGKAIDVISIIATLFGVAVSLGLGTLQINAGLGEVFGLPVGIPLQMIIIAVTAVGYMLSASTPIEKGVNFLSQASIVLAVVLLAFIVVVGPTVLQLNAFTQGIGDYVTGLVPMSMEMSAFAPSQWLGDWTIFFWATWIAWAPYVGAFIARISRGRTVREFLLGVLVAPSLFGMVWFAVFGATAIDLDESTGGKISTAAENDEALSLFTFLGEYPLFLATGILALFLIWIFFVAGADAGTIVLGSMSSGVLEPNRAIKLTWGVIMGALAAILLVAGGLTALQNGAILAATPFAVIMVFMSWSLYRALSEDYDEIQRSTTQGLPVVTGGRPADGSTPREDPSS